MSEENYPGYQIKVLSAQEAVRKRPAMYFGPVDQPSTLSGLVQDVLCLALDEAYSGKVEHIAVTLHFGNAAKVEWDGPGLPIDEVKTFGKPAIELLLTHLFACRDMKQNAEAKKFCAAGIAAVNFVSQVFYVETIRDGWVHQMEFRHGNLVTPLHKRAPADDGTGELTGTVIEFVPDKQIFGEMKFDEKDLLGKMHKMREDINVILELEDRR